MSGGWLNPKLPEGFTRRPWRPELQLEGPPTSADSERGTRTFRTVGLGGTAAPSIWNEGCIIIFRQCGMWRCSWFNQ
eukprot:744992-Alexandrium_andersonii.AAC.1